jgi:hypothetical protein
MSDMKQIFTYPSNSGTDWIDPLYIGDATSGLTRRVDDLLDGTYRNWYNLDPVSDLGTTNTELMQTLSKFINYQASVQKLVNYTVNDMWYNPLVVATKKLIDGETVTDATVDTTSAVITVDGTHDFDNDMQVAITGFNNSWTQVPTGDNYYASDITASTLKLRVGSSTGPYVRFIEVNGGDISSATAAAPCVFTIAGHTLTNGMLVELSGFDGTLILENGNQFYVQNVTTNTFTLSTDASNVDPLNYGQNIQENYMITTFDGSDYSQAILHYPGIAQPWVTGDFFIISEVFTGVNWGGSYSQAVNDKIWLEKIDNYNFKMFEDEARTTPITLGSGTYDNQLYGTGGVVSTYHDDPDQTDQLPGVDVDPMFYDASEFQTHAPFTAGYKSAGWVRGRQYWTVGPYTGWIGNQYFGNGMVTAWSGNGGTSLPGGANTNTQNIWSTDVFYYNQGPDAATSTALGEMKLGLQASDSTFTGTRTGWGQALYHQAYQRKLEWVNINGVKMKDVTAAGIPITESGALITDVLVSSTTGTVTEVITPADAGQFAAANLTAATTGSIAVASGVAYPYELDTLDIILPGNVKYSYLDTNGASQYGAEVDTTKFWNAGDTSSTTFASTGETSASFTTTVNSYGYLDSITITQGVGPEGTYANDDPILYEIKALDDQYTPPTPTAAELEDVWDTDDEWASDGFASGLKEWPMHVTPKSAVINYNSPTLVNNSQSGIKYTRSVGHTKWRLDVEYPPMSAEDFQKFHAVAQAAHGQSTPFYFILQNKDYVSILWRDFYDQNNTSNKILVKDAITAGDTTMLVEGFSSNEANAYVRGEVFIAGAGNHNGYLHTSLSSTDANIFGEAKIRTPWPFRTDQIAGSNTYKNPYHCTVTLADDNFEYQVDVDNYYYVSVAFDLDAWK